METIAIASLVTLIVIATVLVVQLGLIARRFGQLVKKLEGDLPDLIEKADTAIDSIQEQIGKVEAVVDSAQSVTRSVQATAAGAQQLVSSPLTLLAAVITGAGKSLRGKRREKP